MNKVASSPAEAIGKEGDGSNVIVASFGNAGIPDELVFALLEHGPKDVAGNCAGGAGNGMEKLLKAGRVSKMFRSFSQPARGLQDDDLINACKQPVTLLAGGQEA